MAKNYTGTDFLEWYKANYNKDYDANNSAGLTRGANMSDEDWALGNSLYDYYKSGQALDQRKTTALDDLRQQYTDANQSAFVNNELLMKYLPTKLNAAGLGASGATETSMIAANNAYMNRRADALRNYLSGKNDILTNYETSKLALDKEKGASALGILNEYYGMDEGEGENPNVTPADGQKPTVSANDGTKYVKDENGNWGEEGYVEHNGWYYDNSSVLNNGSPVQGDLINVIEKEGGRKKRYEGGTVDYGGLKYIYHDGKWYEMRPTDSEVKKMSDNASAPVNIADIDNQSLKNVILDAMNNGDGYVWTHQLNGAQQKALNKLSPDGGVIYGIVIKGGKAYFMQSTNLYEPFDSESAKWHGGGRYVNTQETR